jgi:hypothetical protein
MFVFVQKGLPFLKHFHQQVLRPGKGINYFLYRLKMGHSLKSGGEYKAAGANIFP